MTLGTSSPTTQLHVTGTEGLLIQGTYNSGTALDLGGGTRMHFYPKKAAFRAGYVDSSQWDDANIGIYSTAMGVYITASGDYSTAMGRNTTASGSRSTAMGYPTTASGSYSTAMGDGTTAESGFEIAIGRYNTDYAPSSTTWWNTADRLFVIGNGTDSGARSDAFLILKNGNATLAGILTQNSDIRLKERIRPLDSAIDKILQLDGKYFYRNKIKSHDTENEQIGLIAQEVQKVIPQLVSTDQTEDACLSVNYQGFVPVLINATKEQQVMIDELRITNYEMKEMVQAQQLQIDQLIVVLAMVPEKESLRSRLVSVFRPKKTVELGYTNLRPDSRDYDRQAESKEKNEDS